MRVMLIRSTSYTPLCYGAAVERGVASLYYPARRLRILDHYTNTPPWGLLPEESSACRLLEDLTDTFPSAR